ncbi:MAG: hypothetical protein WBP45_06730 [Daejeonella sp.]
MIIFGLSSEKQVEHFELIGSSCPSCSKAESLRAIGFIRYAHVWYIPMFPGGKRAVAICSHCQYCMQGREIPANIASQLQQCREEIKYPWYYWSGLMVIAGIGLFGSLLSLFK